MIEIENDRKPGYRFGSYLLSAEPRALYRGNEHVEAGDRTILLLLELLRHPGQVAGKYDLIERLWPDQDVSEWSLSRLVSDTRQLLGECANDQGLIQTVRGKGFRLDPDVAVSIVESSVPAAPILAKTAARRLGWMPALASMAALAVGGWYLSGSDTAEDLQVLVLPVDVQTGDDQDSWVEYGVMTVLTGQLQRFPELQVADVEATLRALNQIGYQPATDDASPFEQVCQPLGCNKLVAVNLSLNDSGIPELRYRIHESSKQSQSYPFASEDVLQASGTLFDHLLQKLLPPQPERVALDSMYTDDIRANRNFALGASSVIQGDYEIAENYLQMALQQKPDYFWARAYMSDVYVRTGKYDQAEELLEELADAATDRRQLLHIEKVRSNISNDRGNLEQSLEQARAMLEIAIELGDRQAEGLAHMNMGATLQYMGANIRSEESLLRALEIFREHGYKLREAQTTFNLGNVNYALSDLVAAEERYQSAATMFRKLGATQFLAYVRYALSAVKLAQGRLDQAEKDFLELQAHNREIGNTEGELLIYCELGMIEMLRGKPEKAAPLLRTAYDRSGETYTYAKSWASGLLVIAYLNMAQPAMAGPYLDEREKSGWFDSRAPLVFVTASYAHASGDYAGAVQSAHDIRSRIGEQWSEEHDEWLRAFQQSVDNGTPTITDYYRLGSAQTVASN